MSSRDAKWLSQMILKSFSPVMLPDSFDSALDTLAFEKISRFPPHPEPGLVQDLAAITLDCLNPNMGVKVGWPDYYKARSIKHCCQMVDRRRMSIERKYDGEYCQIHIDLSKNPNIQIFSNSGKDSAMDRSGIHEALRDALRIGSPKCTMRNPISDLPRPQPYEHLMVVFFDILALDDDVCLRRRTDR